MACQIAARPPGTCGLLRPSRLMAWIAGRTKHSTKNSLFVGSAAGDMTSASGMARKSCVRSAFHQIASRPRRSDSTNSRLPDHPIGIPLP